MLGFEGPEKKFELVTKETAPSFRKRDEAFWHELVQQANASVLSKISNEHIDAYLLSESSLFVFDNRVVMITCGTTTLAAAAVALLQSTPKPERECFIFERKNENFPHAQESSFEDDIAQLRAQCSGTSITFGEPTGDCIKLFTSEAPCTLAGEDHTIEILMHGVSPALRKLCSSSQTAAYIGKESGFATLLPDATVDEYAFEPAGYSLNAIRGSHYYTIHVTPESGCSYVSFESNYSFQGSTSDSILQRLLQICEPQRFDMLTFDHEQSAEWLQSDELQARYQIHEQERAPIACGYQTHYAHGERQHG